MTDPLGLIGQSASIAPPAPRGIQAGETGKGFKELLASQLAEVNQLQQDATAAAEDVVTGRRDDVEGVIIATQKADTAFRMLLQVRNKMMEAYDEVKQIRV